MDDAQQVEAQITGELLDWIARLNAREQCISIATHS